MGFDTYMRWKGQTDAERDAQYIGGSICGGHVGYLRGPFALHIVPSGAWDTPAPAAYMRERLPKALNEVDRCAGGEVANQYRKSLEDFVALAERMESETGEPVLVSVH